MGQVSSYVRSYIKEEFDRVRSDDRDYIVFHQILTLKPLDDTAVDFKHLGTLFVLDKDRDGVVSLQELEDFASVCSAQANKTLYEFQTQLQAYCTLELWHFVGQAGGTDEFVEWIRKLLRQDLPVQRFKGSDEEFINGDTVMTLHEMLSVEQSYGIDFQSFFDMTQRVSEEKGLMSLEDERMDDYVPIATILDFVRDFIDGFTAMMLELGFDSGGSTVYALSDRRRGI